MALDAVAGSDLPKADEKTVEGRYGGVFQAVQSRVKDKKEEKK